MRERSGWVKIYALKLIAAALNLILVSYIVRDLPDTLSEQYLLALAYIVLGSLICGLGVDTALERYALRILAQWPKTIVASTVVFLSGVRVALLVGGLLLLDIAYPDALKVHNETLGLAFATFLFTSFSSLLNGVLLYTQSAASNVLRATSRFMILFLPLGAASLENLLRVEIFAALLSALFCLSVFLRHELKSTSKIARYDVVLRFMGWNWAARLLLNLLSLNTVKILVLRSGHPYAVLIAYTIQLTEAVERFLPSLVLAGKYRPTLAKDFDDGRLNDLSTKLRALGVKSLSIGAAISIAQLALLPLALIYIQNSKPNEFLTLIILCGGWLFLNNIKFSVNTVSNIIEANHIPFWASGVLCIVFFAGLKLLYISSPVGIFAYLVLLTLCYPFFWLGMSYRYLYRLKATA